MRTEAVWERRLISRADHDTALATRAYVEETAATQTDRIAPLHDVPFAVLEQILDETRHSSTSELRSDMCRIASRPSKGFITTDG